MSKFAVAAILGGLLSGAALPAHAQASKPIAIVAAENFYGDIAKQIGGANVTVTSILTNPDRIRTCSRPAPPSPATCPPPAW